jgi:hypothetical protein
MDISISLYIIFDILENSAGVVSTLTTIGLGQVKEVNIYE